jgi:5-hydroxyisourate hydrolase
MARLSTHVLDTAIGKPAQGVAIELYRCEATERVRQRSAVTNSDGRTDAPLLEGESIAAGVYELVFAAGDYLRARGVSLTDPPFLDHIVIRFGIADPAGRYHVPLLLSPYGYSTYLGS